MAEAELITLGGTYNVTLVVGKPEDRNEQKRIRVNTKILKLANPVWTAMLNDRFVEGPMSEVTFSDDNSLAFLIALQIMCSKTDQLPEYVDIQNDLIDLAAIGNKYDITQLIYPHVRDKRWMEILKRVDGLWVVHQDIIRWIGMCNNFNLTDDVDYLLKLLALCSCEEANSLCYWVIQNNIWSFVPVENHLSARDFNRVKWIRSQIKTDLLTCAEQIMKDAVELNPCTRSDPMKNNYCKPARVGFLAVELTRLGLYSVDKHTPPAMNRGLGSFIHPNSTEMRYWRAPNGCYQSCLGDLNLYDRVQRVFAQYMDKRYLDGWAKDEFRWIFRSTSSSRPPT